MKTHKSNMSRKKSKDSKHTSSTFVEISYRISAICVLCFFIGCSQLIDNGKGPLSLIPGLSVFSDGESPRVIGSWPLNDQTIADPKAALSISFSKEMNQTFTESALSLKSSQNTIAGSYSWLGSTLHFQPTVSLTDPGIYTLTVSKSQAEDKQGKNLEQDFILKFNYNADTIEPTLVDSSPSNGAIGITSNTHLLLRFSKPMNVNLVLTEITANPSLTFNLPVTIISPDRTTFEFIPIQPLTFGTTYNVTIPNTIKDSIGNPLLQTYRIGFTVGSDFVQPTLTNIRSTTNTGNFVLNEFAIIGGFEKTDDFMIDFSESVLPSSLLTGITFSPSITFTIIENSGGANTSFIIRPNSNLSINQIYQIQVTNSVKDVQGNSLNKTFTYNTQVNGPRSKYLFVQNIYLSNAHSLANRLLDGVINSLQHDGGIGPTYNYSAGGAKAFYVAFCRDDFRSNTCSEVDLNMVLSSVQFSANFDFGPNSGNPYLLLPQVGAAPNIYKTSIFGLTESPNSYIFTIKGGPDGAKDLYGNYLEQDYSVRFSVSP